MCLTYVENRINFYNCGLSKPGC